MRMTATFAAKVFAVVAALVVIFQFALMLGAPWGEFTMGGGTKGALSSPLRLAAGLQAFLITGCIAVVLAQAGILRVKPGRVLNGMSWSVTALFAVSLVLNLITPSAQERALWFPVTLILFLAALRVAASR